MPAVVKRLLGLGCAFSTVAASGSPDATVLVQTSTQADARAKSQVALFKLMTQAMSSQGLRNMMLSKPHKHHKHRNEAEDQAQPQVQAPAQAAEKALAPAQAQEHEAAQEQAAAQAQAPAQAGGNAQASAQAEVQAHEQVETEAEEKAEVAAEASTEASAEATAEVKAQAAAQVVDGRHKKNKHKKIKHTPTLPPVRAGCSKEDFEAVDKRFKALAKDHGTAVGQAVKDSDMNATVELLRGFMPSECEATSIVSPAGVNWANFEACLTKGTYVSRECVACPVNFLQGVVGKSLVDAPFACPMKCMPAITSAFKCGEAGGECDENVLIKYAKCMKCISPKIAELAYCAGLPTAKTTEVRLQKLLKAAADGEEALDALLEEDAADGREELREHKDKPALEKLLTLGFSILVD